MAGYWPSSFFAAISGSSQNKEKAEVYIYQY